MNNAGIIFEILWFVLGGLMLFIGIEQTLDGGFSSSWHYLLFAVLALLMYYRRRRIRLSEKRDG